MSSNTNIKSIYGNIKYPDTKFTLIETSLDKHKYTRPKRIIKRTSKTHYNQLKPGNASNQSPRQILAEAPASLVQGGGAVRRHET